MPTTHFRWKRLVAGLACVMVAGLGAFAPLAPGTVERTFSTGTYPFVQRVMTTASNSVPFALLDVWLVLGVGLGLRGFARAVRQAIGSRSGRPIARLLFRLSVSVAAAYSLFLVLWGFNYRREPMLSRVVTTQDPVVSDAVFALGSTAVAQLNALHDAAHADAWATPEWRQRTLTDSAARVQEELTGVAPAVPGRLKKSLLGSWFRWNGIDGMVNPFGLEVLANPDLLPYERPFVASHEWAHLAGFASEAEASFVGFLSCVRSTSPADRYSGWLFLYWQVAGEGDPTSRRQLSTALDKGPQADVSAIIERLQRGQLPILRTASWQAYDQYLKANRVESGVRNYGEVLTLLVRTRFEPEWVPVTRSLE